jgi:hypothetical protein
MDTSDGVDVGANNGGPDALSMTCVVPREPLPEYEGSLMQFRMSYRGPLVRR